MPIADRACVDGDESAADAALRTAVEAFIAMDADGRVLSWNAAAARLFGYESGAAVGRELAELIVPSELRDAHRHGLQRYLSTRLGRIVGQRTEVQAVDRAGRRFPAELAVWAIPGERTPWFAAMLRDMTDLVTERERALEEIQQTRSAERELSSLVDHAPIGMAVVGLDGRWLRVNPALARLTGYPAADLLHQTFQQITHPDDVAADLALMQQLRDGQQGECTLDKRYRRADGSYVWVSLSVSLVRDDRGAPVHFICQIQDITDRRARQQELERRAMTDALTGLADRSVLDETTRQALTALSADGAPVALVLIDLDGFKPINDTHGHLAGDTVLVEVARRLHANARGRDVAARFGGDEFAILLDSPDRGALHNVAERLVELLRRPIRLPSGHTVVVTASIGIATAITPGMYTAALYGRADQAMYTAKEAGGDGFHIDESSAPLPLADTRRAFTSSPPATAAEAPGATGPQRTQD